MNLTIAVLPGDGIGPEVIAQARRVLITIEKAFGHSFKLQDGAIGGQAIDTHGCPLPDETLNLCANADAVLLGAIGDTKYDNDPEAEIRPEQGLLALRKSLGLFANIRPIKVYDALKEHAPIKGEIIKNTDILIFRELIGGIYFGKKEQTADGKQASDLCVYSTYEIERIGKLAFEAARKRTKHLTLVDKANVLATSRLWRKTIKQIAIDYPDVTLNFLFVDNAAMQLILNPQQFDVLLTENLFGDILSDESSVICGSIGIMASASIGTTTSLYEPIHGSYPQAKGKNIANPFAAILSAAMLLRDNHLGKEASLIEHAVEMAINKGKTTQDLNKTNALTTIQAGAFVTNFIEQHAKMIA